MLGRDGSDRNRDLLSLAMGAAAGLAAGAAAAAWQARRRGAGAAGPPGARDLEESVVDALSGDALIGARAIEVAALSDGIIELAGAVRTEDEARRAVEVAQDVRGVNTVLNRLDVGILERQLEENRARYRAGDAPYHATGWQGMGVGTGMRRQSHETDPDRPDDRVPIMEHTLGVDRMEEAESEDIEKLSPAVEGGATGNAAPTDRYRVDDASHRRLGNVPDADEEPIQDLNPEAGIHENVKEGTELTLEESGLEKELERRDLEDRS